MRIQLIVALAIVVVGGGVLGGEYYLTKWYPRHKQKITDETLRPIPYHNEALGIEMQVAAGIYDQVDEFSGGVRISRSILGGATPLLTITSQPNPDHTFEFSPEILAKWQTRGTYENIPQYNFEATKIMNREAALIWQVKNHTMDLTAHILSPDRIIEAECTPGGADEALYMQACENSLRSIKVAGPEPPAPPKPVEQMPSFGHIKSDR